MSEQEVRERISKIAEEFRYRAGLSRGYSHAYIAPETLVEAATLIESLLTQQAREKPERDTPMPVVSRKATEQTKNPAGGGIWGIRTTIWFCPKCGMFNTPTHNFCWKCGQALLFNVATEPKGEHYE